MIRPRQIVLQSPTQKTTKFQKKSIRDHVAKDTLAASEMTVIIFCCTGQQQHNNRQTAALRYSQMTRLVDGPGLPKLFTEL